MEIRIKKGGSRNTLTCIRDDGSLTSSNLGPSFPNHDIAHFVVEKMFQMNKGFYGMINAGMTVEDLSDKEVIKRLDPEIWLAEVFTRNLQGIGSGATNVDQFIEIVKWEITNMEGLEFPEMKISAVEQMKNEFDQLCIRWNELSENEFLTLMISF